MRIIFTLACIYLFIFSSKAQFSKGTNQLSGTIYFATENRKNDLSNTEVKSRYLSFAPSIGHFYRNNRLAGIQLYYGGNYEDGYPSSNTAGGGVFLRQYVKLGKSDFFVYANERANVYLGRNSRYTSQGNVRLKTATVSAGIAPGISYAFSKKLQFDLSVPEVISLQYQRSKPKESNTEAESTSSFGVSSGLSSLSLTNVGIGLSWSF